jgi:hypothetical protein
MERRGVVSHPKLPCGAPGLRPGTQAINLQLKQTIMTNQIVQFLVTVLSFIGFVFFIFSAVFVAMDALEVYLKFREHVLNGDLAKRKDGK